MVFVLVAIIIVVVAVSAFTAMEVYNFGDAASKKPFYVGVTYCGNSTTEAEQLIDRVKNYTNLFVLDSGTMMQDLNATEQICDYAVNSGLNIIVSYGTSSQKNIIDSFLSISQERWDSHFLGLYYDDESGGKMLDSTVYLHNNSTDETVVKQTGLLTVNSWSNDTSTTMTFSTSGGIFVANSTMTYAISNGTLPSTGLPYPAIVLVSGPNNVTTTEIILMAGTSINYSPMATLLTSQRINQY